MKYFATPEMALAAVSLSCLLFTASTKAGTSAPLLDCGGDKVVLLDDATSKDGGYAIGWTFRARTSKVKPVDWSSWDPNSTNDFFNNYDFIDPDIEDPGSAKPSEHAPYEVFDCAVDLKKKQVLPLPSTWPYWPDKNHASFRLIWSPPAGGTQYALVDNDGRWSTENLWLVGAGESGMRETDLSQRLNAAVETVLKAKRPVGYERYAISWLSNADEQNMFKGSTARLDFSAAIPKEDETVDGFITLDMASGTLGKVACDTPADDPFKDNPELAKADQELNRTYAQLLGQLNETRRAALKKEQRAWLDSRNSTAEDEDARGPNQTRDQSLIQSTMARTAELRKRLRE
jgi:uncharacterized protein YecT (DUF1311 family)